jgi:hypothetical protein
MPAEAVKTVVNLEEALATLNKFLDFAGVKAVPKINQYLKVIEIEGINLFHADGGWGVSKTVYIPGCHTLPNGDPGYPDEWEDEIISESVYNVPSIVGTKTLNRQLEDAVIVVIEAVVKERLNRAPFYFL